EAGTAWKKWGWADRLAPRREVARRGLRYRRRATRLRRDPDGRPLREVLSRPRRRPVSPAPPRTMPACTRLWMSRARAARSMPLLRPEHPEHLSVGGCQFAQHATFLRRVAGTEAFDGHLSACLDDARLIAIANHPAGGACFERPLLGLAAFVLHIEHEPRVGVAHQDVTDDAVDGYRLFQIVGRGERMMRPCRYACGQRDQTGNQHGENFAIHVISLSDAGIEAPKKYTPQIAWAMWRRS